MKIILVLIKSFHINQGKNYYNIKRTEAKPKNKKKEKHCIVKNIDKNYQSKSVRGIMRIKMKLIKDETQDTYAYVELKTLLKINRSTKKHNDIKSL